MHLFNALVSSLLVAAAVAAGIPGSGAQALGKRACDPANCIAQVRIICARPSFVTYVLIPTLVSSTGSRWRGVYHRVSFLHRCFL